MSLILSKTLKYYRLQITLKCHARALEVCKRLSYVINYTPTLLPTPPHMGRHLQIKVLKSACGVLTATHLRAFHTENDSTQEKFAS